VFVAHDAVHTAATSLSTNAALASTAIGTIIGGSDGLVSNFASLQVSLTNIVSLADAFIGGFYCPVGMITPYGAAAPPDGWLLCTGDAVSRSTYAVLFAIIASTYGAGDGSSTFNTPNLQGRIPMGLGTGASQGLTGSGVSSGGTALTTRTIGGFIGDERTETHTHSVSGSASGSVSGSTGPGDWNAFYNHYGALSGSGAVPVSTSEGTGRTYQGAGGGHAHSFSASLAGGSISGTAASPFSGTAAAANLPPSLIVNYIIKY